MRAPAALMVGAMEMQRMVAPFQDIYSAALSTNPFATRSLVCAALFASSDAIAQLAQPTATARLHGSSSSEESGISTPHLDGARLGRMALYAAAVDAPLSGMFVKNVEQALPGTDPRAVLMKALTAQALWGPTIIAVFLIANELLEAVFERQRVDVELHEVRGRWQSAVSTSWQLWPIVHMVNFAFVPEEHRVVFTAFINLFWVAYLSIVANE
jgi:protein Mpv17